MKLIELLEKNKDNLLTELAASRKAEKAVIVLENELDRLLMVYNESCDSERQQHAAAYMMQAIRLSLPLIDTAGETKVWESSPTSSGKGRPVLLIVILLAAAVILCGIGLVPLIAATADAEKDPALLRTACFSLGGLAAALVAGLMMRSPAPKKTEKTRRVETLPDPDRIYRSFRNAILSVDQNLDEIRTMESWDKKDEAGLIEGREISSSELDLFSDLLAAACSQDPEYALEKIEDIRYYLHRQQIEVVDYSRENAHFFDMMPGQYTGTIRPALVADGKLLRKGMASAGGK